MGERNLCKVDAASSILARSTIGNGNANDIGHRRAGGEAEQADV